MSRARGRGATCPSLHLVVPGGIDDDAHPSGGNVYDRHLGRELSGLGWEVREHLAPGRWPRPRPADEAAVARSLAALPDRSVVLVDGLVGSAVPSAILPVAARLRVVVLLHMPLAEAVPDEAVRRAEREVLSAAHAVVTPSRWARDWVVGHHGVRADRVHVAEPGADRGQLVPGSTSGRDLLCVAAVTHDKGHDVLVAALARIRDLDWRCRVVGALDLEPAFADRVRTSAARAGIADRLIFTGPLTGDRLEGARSASDLVVSASRRESFGMAVTEGLARGIPVVATAVGGQPEAVGRTDDGSLPGLLVPADDADRLADQLRRWLRDPDLRARLRRSAARRRDALGTWRRTAERVVDALTADER